MKLSKWMELVDRQYKDMATDLKIAYPTLWRYKNGKALPRPDEMRRIYEYTEGAVEPNDFYDFMN